MVNAKHLVDRGIRVGAALAALVLAGSLAGCTHQNSAMLLDLICNDETTSGFGASGCHVEGDARFTSGISGDSMAVLFGPEGGALVMRVNAIDGSRAPSWTFDVLASSSRPEANTIARSLAWGSCGASCPADPADVEAPLSDDYQWITVVDAELGTNYNQPPNDALLTLRGTSVHLLDVRTPGYDPLDEFSNPF